MGLNPCCFGIPLQTGCKIIAVLQIIASVLILLSSILGLIAIGIKSTEDKNSNGDDNAKETDKISDDTVVIVVLSLILTCSLIGLILSVVLYRGAKNKKRKKLLAWLWISLILLVVMVVKFIVDCIYVKIGHALELVQSAGYILLNSYCIFVVWCYRQELKHGDDA